MEKHFSILDEKHHVVGSVWAESVRPKRNPSDGFDFVDGGNICATAWFGYEVVATQERVFTPAAEVAA